MQTVSEWRPTHYDSAIGAFAAMADRKDWLVLPVSRTRDSDVLSESNFAVALRELGRAAGEREAFSPDEAESFETHRFGHWGPGWYEVIIVQPGTRAARCAQELADSLADYPVLDDAHFSEAEQEAAMKVWEGMSPARRVEHIRQHFGGHRLEFHFDTFASLLSCVRGDYFPGDAYDLVRS